ncbi:hypothetical protein [Bradyrhizobium sp. STM 3557]|uniref:hypothetical protein n=1 Tax=Bradyrhizobium sp. STM 3557 TaxID=578920 RepID=UPI00388FD412
MGGFHGGGFGGFHHGGFHHHGFGPAFVLGFGVGYPYYGYDGYYPYVGDYAYSHYGYGESCYIVRHRVRTPYGWRYRSEQVCE